jgi:hypothetical protein
MWALVYRRRFCLATSSLKIGMTHVALDDIQTTYL